ncbi:MAG: GNAT family N-acetyltransferase [Propionibacteriaceae bacterium]|jgi:ribosomal protein S18 acetylase RimI-like enzyme|nr:GNAT family N-acetyltransferase [Propionibacteriaceae bacterium]
MVGVVVEFVDGASLLMNEVLGLYDAVGWTAYTADPATLSRALAGSHRIVAARDEGQLVGLARSVSDGETIVYIQDILVHPSHQRRHIGQHLVSRLLEAYPNVRQRVLLTDSESGQRAFYESLGFVETHDFTPPLRSFVRFVPSAGSEAPQGS